MGDIPEDTIPRTRVVTDADEARDDAVTVLVTGFGPFLEKFPQNASWEIASRLPSHLSVSTPNSKNPKTINILVHPAPITVAYHTAASLIPNLLATHNPDLVLHLGLAANRSHYAIELSSARHGFARTPDVEGRRFVREDLEKEGWDKCPERLETSLDFEHVWEEWEGQARRIPGLLREQDGEGGVEIRASDDVGSFLCGFVYFASLAWFWKRGWEEAVEDRPVIFLHVPDCPGEKEIEQGVLVTEALIRALVESWLAGRRKMM
ncbi:peptidase C15, pyroglutamyl peptidase I-like protein [Saccharata proteae CBS 121410]|uniref:Peptidase C15, pyroglutamyl peptidase I-like protein n=1 Tax=Saccharata proteae CBS 121410 TaxID=1314787 RepID=A0A9P4LU80_9PEZI|nr:peptidase C15, pyroglutamyl peptidase I-like protein [Saccharata proteae CBS 121410]